MTANAPTRHESRTNDIRIEDLALRWQRHRDRDARDELFEEFLPLARRLASRYLNPHEPLEDLVQVAAVGLLGAVDRFDPGRGVGFPAFAIPTIVGELKRYFRNTGWSAHVPRGAQEMALRVERAAREISARTGHAASIDAVAEYLEVPVEDVLIGLDANVAHYSMSLDAPAPSADGDDPQFLGDSLGEPEEGYGLVETRLSLAAAIERLPYPERQALTLRIDHDLTQTEIARRTDCSQMQVSRLLRRAAMRLRDLIDPDPSTTVRQSQIRKPIAGVERGAA